MALVPVADTPGLWRDPDWRRQTPGIYALIAGVSNYPHLKGGSAQAEDTFGLGQLEVSARTAAALFDWLRRDYQYKDLPVVWCYLLLSPTEAEERFFQAENLEHYQNPTEHNLRSAIQLWHSSLPTDPGAAGKTRTLFFFSGHGVHTVWDPLLLPSDYLAPPHLDPILERCVSAKEIQEWMQTHPAAEHLALFDACRTEFPALTSNGSTAHRVLPKIPMNAAKRVVAGIAATAPGATAYQTAGDEYTIFGRALMEGLDGAAAAPPAQGDGPKEVEFKSLLKYVMARVDQLIKAHHPALSQDIREFPPSGIEELIVTQVPAAAPQPAAAPRGILGTRRVVRVGSDAGTRARGLGAKPFPTDGGAVGTAAKTRNPLMKLMRLTMGKFEPTPAAPAKPGMAAVGRAQLGETPADWRKSAERAQESHLTEAVDLGKPVSGTGTGDGGAAVRYFGPAVGTTPWSGFGLHSIQGRRSLDDSLIEVVRVMRDQAGTVARVDAELAPEPGGMLAVFSPKTGGTLVMPLPTDEHSPVPVRLTMTFQGQELLGVEGQLGPSTLPHYEYLWKLSRLVNFASYADAAGKADPEQLREAVRDKMQARCAAVAGAIILARGGMIDRIGDWTRNLMDWFPDIPDGAVLWAESLRAAMAAGHEKPFDRSDPLEAMAEAVGLIEERGLPFFAGALELLDNQLRYLDGKRGSLSYKQARRLGAVRGMIDQVFQVARPSGRFLLLSALPRPAGLGQPDKPLDTGELLEMIRPG